MKHINMYIVSCETCTFVKDAISNKDIALMHIGQHMIETSHKLKLQHWSGMKISDISLE